MRVANRSSATALLMPAAMVLLLVAALAQAQPYPSKPVRVAVGFPAARPPELIQRMNKLWVASLRTQETRDLLYAISVGAAGSSVEDFNTFRAAEGRKWGELIRKINLKLE